MLRRRRVAVDVRSLAMGRPSFLKDLDMPDVVLHTNRLILRPFRAEDIDPYAEMCADPEVMEFLSADGGLLSRAEAWRQVAMFLGHWELRGFGTWAVEEKATGRFAGRIGLHFPEGWPDRELGWTLGREFWGRGFATEGARAAMIHAFKTLGWTHLVSLIHPENHRSAGVAVRLGQRLQGSAEVRGLKLMMYRVEATGLVTSSL